ncbi:MAG TPA: M23 family metallopeptidase [Baekduia sp.]|uniref:M23 family metallopeptidase n=1 Tax=Baekduia sp. TaxID=2600305 RepID=UPI002CEECA96|nr:M23 family metallopeptidase [Baekduia sp.]HMJ33292.1 M23 family metallopeptidase [Baekduia sp.]
MPSIAIVLLAVLTLAAPGRAAASAPDRWQRPLPGAAVARTFSFDPAAPYLRGGRRGIDLRGRPGARVLATCSGTVAYAGRVPGWGPGVTLRCGDLVATELGLAGPAAVRRGARVAAGAVLGRLGSRGVLRLGARRAGGRQAYVDPLALLDGDPSGPAPPVPVAPPSRRVPRPPAPPAVSPRAPAAAQADDPAPARLPWPIWVGLGLLAAGAGGGTVAHRRRGRRAVTGAALAHRYR